MRIECPHCLKKARIRSRNNLTESKTVVDLYCECTNQACKSTFVCIMSFKHDLNPPAKTTAQIAQNLLNRLSAEERAQLQVA
jgi:hypothetical protein